MTKKIPAPRDRDGECAGDISKCNAESCCARKCIVHANCMHPLLLPLAIKERVIRGWTSARQR